MVDQIAPSSLPEADKLDDTAYEDVYEYYVGVFDELIEEFNEEALEPDIFFAEYGVTSVYEEKVEQMEIEVLQALDGLDDVFQSGRGNEDDWELWTNKTNELYMQKLQELEEAYEVMLAY